MESNSTNENDTGRWLVAMAVHLFTASGALWAFLALIAVYDGDVPGMFRWLALALVVDGADGTLARWVGVQRYAPRWDGALLDFVVDYMTYVIVPLMAVWRAGFLPEDYAPWTLGAIAAASALYFADRDMKLDGHWFRGFPALWNVLVLYIFTFPLPEMLNLAVLGFAAALMFAPIRFVHPLRVERLRWLTLTALALWFVAAGALVLNGFSANPWPRFTLLLTGLYMLLLPLAIRRTAPAN